MCTRRLRLFPSAALLREMLLALAALSGLADGAALQRLGLALALCMICDVTRSAMRKVCETMEKSERRGVRGYGRSAVGSDSLAHDLAVLLGCYPCPLLIDWMISFLILIAKQARAYTPIGFDFLRYERDTASPRGGGGERRTKTPS